MIGGLIVTAPGSRVDRDHGHGCPLEKMARAVLAAARRIEHAIGQDRTLKAELEQATDDWMQLQRELVAAARTLEQAARRDEERRGELRAELMRGFRDYERAVGELPKIDARLARLARVGS